MKHNVQRIDPNAIARRFAPNIGSHRFTLSSFVPLECDMKDLQ